MLVLGRLEAKLLKHTDHRIDKLVFLPHKGLGGTLMRCPVRQAPSLQGSSGKCPSLHLKQLPQVSSKVSHQCLHSSQREVKRTMEGENMQILTDLK